MLCNMAHRNALNKQVAFGDHSSNVAVKQNLEL